jgi:hypothetical protein
MSEQSADGVWCLGKRITSNKKINTKHDYRLEWFLVYGKEETFVVRIADEKVKIE